MTAEPYTPGEADLIEVFAVSGWAEAMAKGEEPNMPKHRAEARRGIAKIRADALREAAEATRGEAPGEPHAGASFGSHADWLEARADRLLDEINEGEA